jgi:hypothetical protein
MVTDTGTASKALLSEIETVVPPAGDALASATVQVLAAFELTLLGEQTIEDSVAVVVRLMEAVLETPLSVAVTVAV